MGEGKGEGEGGWKLLKWKCCKREEKHICFRLWDGEEGKGRGRGERENGKKRKERGEEKKMREEGVKMRGKR